MSMAYAKSMSGLRRSGFFAFGLREACAYILCLMLVFAGYHMCSDGKFSAIVCLGSVFQALSFVLLYLKLRVRPSSANGISLCMLQMYVIVYALRLHANLRFEDYLPVDSVGDWAYQCVDLCSLGMVAYIMYFVWQRRKLNIFGEESIAENFPVAIISVLCIAASFFLRPGRIQDTLGDMSWVSAHYLEAFVMVPQLMLVTRNAEVEAFTAHSIACVFAAKLCSLAFQWRYFMAFASATGSGSAYAIFLTQLFQVILLADFVYYYLKSLVRNSTLSLDAVQI